MRRYPRLVGRFDVQRVRLLTSVAILLVDLILSGSMAGVVAQQDVQRIVVGPNLPVRGDATRPYVEPHLAVNPRNPDNLVAVSIRADSSGYGVVVLASQDGGRSCSAARRAGRLSAHPREPSFRMVGGRRSDLGVATGVAVTHPLPDAASSERHCHTHVGTVLSHLFCIGGRPADAD